MNQQDKSFLITFVVVMSVLVLIAIAIFLAAQMVSVVSVQPSDDGGSRQKAAAEERIKPVAQVAVASAAELVAAAQPKTGEEVYNGVCTACHQAGVLGAPKIGSKEEWAPRFAQGLDTLVNHAVNGIRAMPAKGGNPSLSDDEIRNAIVYMLEKSDIQAGEATTAAAEAPAAPAAEAPAGAPEPSTSTAAAPAKTAGAGADLAIGKEVYGAVCTVCHEAGVAGAPKHGDKAAWEPRAQQGMATLLDHALNGFKAMPAKGGNPNLSESDVRNAIVYMLSEAGIEMSATAAPAAAPQTPAATSEPAASASPEKLQPAAAEGAAAPAQATEAPAPPASGKEAPSDAPKGAAPAKEAPAGSQDTDQKKTSAKAKEGSVSAAPMGRDNAREAAATPVEHSLLTLENIDLAHGKQLYNTACVVCHTTGAAGAPKLGDRMAWVPRLGQGWEKLVEGSLARYKDMAKGSRLDVPDEEIIAAVGYMVSKVQ